MIALRCQHCDRALKVKPDLAGKKVKCPGCAKVVVVPGPVAVGEDLRTLPPSAAQERPADKPRELDREFTSPSLSQPDATQTPEPKDEHDSSLTDFLAPPQADDELGRLGSFRILKILGHGGMGVVFMGEDPKLGRKVAIKAMLPHLAQSRSSQQRFLREAKSAAAIEHDHIVPILHVDEDRGSPFIVMPFLQGEPLDKRLARGKLPLGDVLRIAREIARGLAAAHKRGLIHRDIKPANVWLETTENVDRETWAADEDKPPAPSTIHRSRSNSFRVKILDFGLARAAAQDSGLTQQGAIIGTPAYMAPEQGRGEAVDARCDLWSLGVVLYKMLTGAQPFSGKDTVATLMAVAMHEPKAPCEVNPEVPRELSDLTMRLLEKDADKRLAKAEEAATALAHLEKAHAQAEDRTALATTARKAAHTVIAEPMATRTQMPCEAAAAPRRPRAILFAALGILLALTAAAVYIVTRPPQDVGPLVTDGKKPVEAPIESPPRKNVALELLGKSSVEIASLRFPEEGPMTLEAWVYKSKGTSMPVANFFGIRKQLNFAIRSVGLVDCRFGPETTAVSGGGPFPRETWTHIAAVWSNNVFTLFVDGKRTGTGKAERTLPNPEGVFVLTGGPKAAMRFAGVRLSNIARYDANFTPSKSFANDAHTLALYHCDEGAGNVLKDSSGNNHHGTIFGGTWLKVDD